MQISRPGQIAGRAPQGEATGSRRSKPFLKDLDFQIYSKYVQVFSKLLLRISSKYQTHARLDRSAVE
jgi:hypothetical protein